MNEIKINHALPKLEVPRQIDDSKPKEKTAPETDKEQNLLRYTTESSMEDNYSIAYRKLNPRANRQPKSAPSSENWLG